MMLPYLLSCQESIKSFWVRMQVAFAVLILVMANGGLLGPSGSYNVAVAASYHSIPLVICTGLYTLCSSYPYNSEKLNVFSNPDATQPFHSIMDHSTNLIHPEFDYVPPHLLALYITNVGPYPPLTIRKLILETYGHSH